MWSFLRRLVQRPPRWLGDGSSIQIASHREIVFYVNVPPCSATMRAA